MIDFLLLVNVYVVNVNLLDVRAIQMFRHVLYRIELYDLFKTYIMVLAIAQKSVTLMASRAGAAGVCILLSELAI